MAAPDSPDIPLPLKNATLDFCCSLESGLWALLEGAHTPFPNSSIMELTKRHD